MSHPSTMEHQEKASDTKSEYKGGLCFQATKVSLFLSKPVHI